MGTYPITQIWKNGNATNMICQLPSEFIAHFQVSIHSVPSRPDLIHHLPSCFIVKPVCCNPFSSFLSLYALLTPITFHSVLSFFDPFFFKPP